MSQYSKEQIETFLRAIDKHLKKGFDLVIIGGTATALGYDVEDYTRDIDVISSIDSIQDACQAAKKETGLNIPMERVTVYDAPYNYQDRLEVKEIVGLKKLSIKVPERHDLVMMKAVMRGYRHDQESAAQIHRSYPLDFETLIHLMDTEMTHVTGDRRIILENFLAFIEELFSDQRVKDAQARLKGWDKK